MIKKTRKGAAKKREIGQNYLCLAVVLQAILYEIFEPPLTAKYENG